MNVLDFVIIGMVGGLVVGGFYGGVGRVVAGCFAVYFATIVAAAFYEAAGSSIRSGIDNIGHSTSNLVGFLLLFFLLGVGFYWVIWQSLRSFTGRHVQFQILDNVGGAALAIVVGTLTLAMTFSVTVILLGVLNQSSAVDAGSMGTLGRQIRGSELVPMFLKMQPTVTSALQPWFPDGLPTILQRPPAV